MALILICGWTFVETASRIGTEFERKNLLTMASIAATSFDPDAVRRLNGNSQDPSSPAFSAIQDKLKRIRGQLPAARFAYLLGQRDGAVYFLADAEDPTSPDYSPPGQSYPEAPPALLRVFSTAEPMLAKPYHDRWGEWVSSFAAVKDPVTGVAVAVFGFDVPANQWRNGLNRLRSVAGIVVVVIAVIAGGWLSSRLRSQQKITVLNDELKAEVAKLAAANRIVENSSTVLFRMMATPSWPLSYVSSNIDHYGYSVAALLGSASAWLDLFNPEDTPTMRDRLEDLKSGNEDTIRTERRFRKGDNSWAWITDYVRAVRDETGRLVAVEGIMTDITQTKDAEARISYLASHDSLTGLSNRAAFEERLRVVFGEARAKQRSFAVLCIDIDHFKDINDAYGHKNGDLFLRSVGERLSATVREAAASSDVTIARFGGDDFAILETDATDPSDVAMFAQRIVKALALPFILNGKPIHVTASIGISLFTKDLSEANELLAQADLALYRAKDAGRDQFRFYSMDMDTNVRERVAMGAELYAAPENRELELYYQPQVEIPSGKIIGVEALMRWNHPTRGLVSPGQFIPIAERNGFIATLGAWAIEAACRQNESWRAEGLTVPVIRERAA